MAAQRGQESERAPVSMRHGGDQALPSPAASMGAGQVGLRPGLVDEDKARGVEAALLRAPAAPAAGDVRPLLLGGAEALFLNVRSSRAQNRHTAP
jgi:hypothetical protein